MQIRDYEPGHRDGDASVVGSAQLIDLGEGSPNSAVEENSGPGSGHTLVGCERLRWGSVSLGVVSRAV